MQAPHLKDPAETPKFHGWVDLRMEITDAVVVATSPIEEHDPYKPMHWHERPFFWMLLEGDCMEYIEGGIERYYEPLVPTFHPAGELHAHRRGPKAPFGFGVILLPGMETRLGEAVKFRNAPQELRAAAARQIGKEMAVEARAGDPYSTLALDGLLLQLCATMGRAESGIERRVPRWLRDAEAALREAFDESVTLGELARSVGVHPAHLAKEFRRHYGCTPGEFVRRLRMEQAKGLLQRGDETVAAIASRVGFYDEAHFCRTFKRVFGVTPSAYRRSIER